MGEKGSLEVILITYLPNIVVVTGNSCYSLHENFILLVVYLMTLFQ
jgi:hypothetical protein